MANGKFDGYFLARFCFDSEGTLYAKYCTPECEFTSDISQAVVFRQHREAELFAIQHDLECQLHGAFSEE